MIPRGCGRLNGGRIRPTPMDGTPRSMGCWCKPSGHLGRQNATSDPIGRAFCAPTIVGAPSHYQESTCEMWRLARCS